MNRLLICVFLTFVCASLAQSPPLTIDSVMTAKEAQQSGIWTLSVEQKTALNIWLVRYTTQLLSARASQPTATSANCSPAIESSISGDFEGWDGETIFKLDNGQIWQQAEYDYTYSYSYRPEVTIYQTRSGCRMKVEDEEETILVKRIR
jgi:hypothetical protein